jgi:hypothetical protein
MSITPEQIKRVIEIAGLLGSQVPAILEWGGKYHFQIFQAGIIHDHTWVTAFPVVIGIAGFAIMLQSSRALWYLLPAAIISAAVAGLIWEYERSTHSLSIYVLIFGWAAWTTFLSLSALSIASMIKRMI